MTDSVAPAESRWRNSRYGFAGFYFLSLLGAWFALRLVLLLAFRPATMGAVDVARALLNGFQRDLFVSLVETLPLLAWFALVPNSRFGARWHRGLVLGASFVIFFGQIFLLVVEFFFFEEFKSRFNTVAVDYLIYPQEVFVNIWESYHVGLIIFCCLLLSLGWVVLAARLFRLAWTHPFSTKSRWLHFAAVLGAASLLAVPLISVSFRPFRLRFEAAHVGTERTLNEIANNGAFSFITAAWTRNLDYSAFYKTVPITEAFERARRMLSQTNAQFQAEGQSILRRIEGDPERPRLNVVIFLEESLGSEFWGCLGRPRTLTPEMDSLAAAEGMLFTNIYACGNRTVRGMEGVLASFPPLPPDSIVKRDLSDNVETIARVLKRDGYATSFLYGGRGVFDGMRSFALRNGYERFIEHNPPFHDDFPNSKFTTAWGVCDEDLFMRAVEEFRELSNTGKPFFATVLSVSNHKPYTYPTGKIPEDPAKKKRANAVKYSDYALGQFFRAARKESFWTNTIFAVVADHGARVYGKQSIPIHSYEIPFLIVGPAVIKAPSRIGLLGCSLDVSPTILGLLGRPYESLFFGRDLMKMAPEDGRVFLNHNRDIGMLARERLVVLGLNKNAEFYQGEPKLVDMSTLGKPRDADLELEKDAVSIYQVADELYTQKRYRIDGGK